MPWYTPEFICMNCRWEHKSLSQVLRIFMVLPASCQVHCVETVSETMWRMITTLFVFYNTQWTQKNNNKKTTKITNISGWKRGATHVEHPDKHGNLEKQCYSRAVGDKGRGQCQCAVNIKREFRSRIETQCPAPCLLDSGATTRLNSQEIKPFSCCVVHVWKANSGKSADQIVQTQCGVHVWKQLMFRSTECIFLANE